MSMEKFERKQDLKSPAVAIRKRGSISFNAPAVKQFGILNKRFVILHFDKEEWSIGIQLTNDRQDLSAFPIVAEKGRTPNISCQAFLRHCGVPFKAGSKVYPAVYDDSRGMILVKLS
jgi:hypothetical protein